MTIDLHHRWVLNIVNTSFIFNILHIIIRANGSQALVSGNFFYLDTIYTIYTIVYLVSKKNYQKQVPVERTQGKRVLGRTDPEPFLTTTTLSGAG